MSGCLRRIKAITLKLCSLASEKGIEEGNDVVSEEETDEDNGPGIGDWDRYS